MRRRLLQAAAVYGISNVVERAVPAVVLVVLTHFLAAGDIGMLAVFMAVVGIATPLVGLNVAYAVRRRFYDDDQLDFPSYLGSAFLIIVAATTATVLVVAIAGSFFGAIAGLDRFWLVVAVVTAAGGSALSLPLTLWQVRHRPGRYARIQVSRAVAIAASVLVLAIGFAWGWRGAALGTCLGTIAIAIPSIAILRSEMRLVWRRAYVANAVRYGGGLLIHTLGVIAITSADRFFIKELVTAAETGLYFAGYQIAFVVLVAGDAMNRAFSPNLYEALKSGSRAEALSIVKTVYWIVAATIGLAALVAVISPSIVPLLFGSEFHSAVRFVPWLAIGFAAEGAYRVIAGFIFYSERTGLVSMLTAVAAVLNIALNALWVPRFGAIGAAYATTAAFVLRLVLAWFAAASVQPMPWIPRRR